MIWAMRKRQKNNAPYGGKGIPSIAFVVDGKTEEWYFKLMREAEELDVSFKFPSVKSDDITNFEEDIEDLLDSGYDKVFWIVDMDVVAKNHLGYTLVDLNRNAEEVKWGSKLIDDAIQQDPKNIAYRDSKAWALYRAGKFEEALKIMEGIEAEKDSLSDEMMHDPSIFSHMAAICEALALKKRAVEYYEKVLTIDPQNENAKSRIEILKKKEE